MPLAVESVILLLHELRQDGNGCSLVFRRLFVKRVGRIGEGKTDRFGISGQFAGSFRGVLEKGVSAGQNMAVADKDPGEGKGASFPGGDPFPHRLLVFGSLLTKDSSNRGRVPSCRVMAAAGRATSSGKTASSGVSHRRLCRKTGICSRLIGNRIWPSGAFARSLRRNACVSMGAE